MGVFWDDSLVWVCYSGRHFDIDHYGLEKNGEWHFRTDVTHWKPITPPEDSHE